MIELSKIRHEDNAIYNDYNNVIETTETDHESRKRLSEQYDADVFTTEPITDANVGEKLRSTGH